VVVNSVDLLPTILDVLGYPLPENIDGISMIRSPAKEDRVVYSESYSDPTLIAHAKRDLLQRAVIRGRWKLIQPAKGPSELYDLSSDPRETQNLGGSEMHIAGALLETLKRWSRGAKAVTKNAEIPDAQVMETLKSLGYVQ
jgi:arylsulfatase A-like enzyme